MDYQRINTRNDTLEFARRTRRNLEFIEAASRCADVHVVTQLTLSLLGLVVFPREKLLLDQVKATTLDHIRESGWPSWTITLDDPEEPTDTLDLILKHLRNAVAHGRLLFTSDSRNINEVGIVVEDKKHPLDPEPYWRAHISAQDLRDFCYRFLDFIEDTVG